MEEGESSQPEFQRLCSSLGNGLDMAADQLEGVGEVVKTDSPTFPVDGYMPLEFIQRLPAFRRQRDTSPIIDNASVLFAAYTASAATFLRESWALESQTSRAREN
jgi:hypothetical protein